MKATIEKVQPGTGKVSTVVVVIPAPEGSEKKPARLTLKHWTEAPFKAQLSPGVEAAIKVEERPGYNGAPPEKWLTEVNGTGEKAQKAGGGGGYKAAPKTALEIHASCVAGLIKSYLEAVTKDKSPAECQTYISLYFDNLKGLN